MSYPIPGGLPTTPPSSLRKPQAPQPPVIIPPNLAVAHLMVELRRLEGLHNKALQQWELHTHLAWMEDRKMDQLSGQRREIERAINVLRGKQ